MERRDLYQDDLTEERYPSPAVRNDRSATQTLDPDASADDGGAKPMPDETAGKAALGYPSGVPGGVKHDPEASTGDDTADDDEDDDDDDDDDDDEEEDLDD